MRRRPACAKAAVVSLSMRKAAIGRSATSLCKSRSGMSGGTSSMSAKRASAQASARVWRERGARGKSLCCKRGDDLGEQRALAAEQMRCAADIEEHAVRGIERRERREAPAPIGNSREELGFRARVGFGNFERRQHGARIGERHAATQTRRLRAGIKRRETLRAFDFRPSR